MGLENRKILITGGMGNLGSWLTHYYCNLGFDVSILTKKVRKLEFDLPFKTIICDISNLEDCKIKLNQRYDIIIHTAGMNDNFVENYAQDAIIVNSLGTRNILESIKEMPPKHFIYLSTFHVYGKNSGEITEHTDLLPTNDYGATHLFAEYYVKQFHQTHKIQYSIIRLSNSYGCPKDYDSSKWYLILNDLSKMAFDKHQIVLKGNGLASRDFIWMGDVSRILHELSTQVAPNETFNLSSGRSYSLLDVAKSVQDAFYSEFNERIEIQVNENDKYKPGEPVQINSDKLKQYVPYKADSHFVGEAKNIFKMLNK